ncbi:MAG: hypothetical protein Ct9H300mP1_34990 [Planctomycetaceae bacterium]|nr:MAG: hypothetical protein Ct9H300mP1_34990 [Planctomycetaceae bacterium]
MFDLKPKAPSNIRGEFKPISTSVPGVQICEHLPRTSRRMRDASLIRTVTHGYNSHHPYSVFSGFAGGKNTSNGPQPHDHPSMGSVLQFLGRTRRDVPGYVFMPAFPGHSQNPRPGAHAGYLGRSCDPLFTVCDPKFDRKGTFYDPVEPIGDSLLPALDALPEVTAERLGKTAGRCCSRSTRRCRPSSRRGRWMASAVSRGRALEMLTRARPGAFDLSQEPGRVRDRYGRHLYGSSLLAPRAAGGGRFDVRRVSLGVCRGKLRRALGHAPEQLQHVGVFHLPMLDQMLTALLDDLEDRGLLDTTLVVVTGEMGRTPRIGKKAGRDHWPQCGFCLMLGGGARRGVVHGTTDKHAGYPIDHPVSPGDLVATIYTLLGVDADSTVPDRLGRPIGISHGGRPFEAVIG